MPSLGADMDAGTLAAWHVKPGDVVARGAVVADVETDKGVVEVEIWEGGVIDALVVAPGTKVPVGTVLATLRPSGSEAVVASPPATAAAPARVLASPSAKQLARDRGVDIALVRGTGPHGAITREDVERAADSAPSVTPSAPPPAIAPVAMSARVAPPDGAAMRRAIAAAMTRSKREIPHYYLSAELDVEAAQRWLLAHNAGRSVTERVLFAALLLKATALAALEVPEVNGWYVEGAYQPAPAVHLGVAISMRSGGLIAPALRDAQARSLDATQAALRDLVARVRAGRLRSSELTDATLTVTSLGEAGVDSVFGVIYPPQVALVGFGRVGERPRASGGMLGVRSVVTATLSADHRVSDGHRGAVFLRAIETLLQQPEKL